MAEPVLSNGQYSIGPPGGPAYVYGYGTLAQVASTATDTGAMNVQDQAIVGQDGLVFGVDTMPGMIVTQTGQCNTGAGQGVTAMDTYAALAGAWNAPATRLANGAVQILRAYYPGSTVVRRCYGRGRKIMPSYGQVFQGLVPFTAQFQAADGIWYDDLLSSVTLTQVPAVYGGITFPVTPPFGWVTGAGGQQNTAINTGPQPTWPVITFGGPITNPSLTYVNTPVTIGWTGQVPAGQSLVIDTRPWARSILLNGSSTVPVSGTWGNTLAVAGALTGTPMIGMQLQPGATVLRFGGQDVTGSATCVFSWHNATLSIGGTT